MGWDYEVEGLSPRLRGYRRPNLGIRGLSPRLRGYPSVIMSVAPQNGAGSLALNKEAFDSHKNSRAEGLLHLLGEPLAAVSKTLWQQWAQP